MAELRCSVENCTYNCDRCCCKGDIMVEGRHAGRKDDTCCGSFKDRSYMGAFTSSISHPSRTISIDCDADKCIYNTNYKCYADHVDIKGCGADTCKETTCATFKEK